MAPGAPASTKYDNERIYFHRLGDSEERDQPVFGPDITADPALPKNGNVFAMVVPGTGFLLAAQVSGVVETPAVWLRSSIPEPARKMEADGEARGRHDGHRLPRHHRLYPHKGRCKRSHHQRTHSQLRSRLRDLRQRPRPVARQRRRPQRQGRHWTRCRRRRPLCLWFPQRTWRGHRHSLR